MKFYTVDEVAAQLSMSAKHVRLLAGRGAFGHVFHPGKRWIFTDENITHYISQPPARRRPPAIHKATRRTVRPL